MKKIIIACCIFGIAVSMAFVRIAQSQDYSDAKNVIEAEAGKDFVITLESNRTTGYEWQLAEPIDNHILEFISSEYIKESTDRIGAGGKEVWTFRGLIAGKTLISFKYVRPWEKDAAAAKKTAFSVTIR